MKLRIVVAIALSTLASDAASAATVLNTVLKTFNEISNGNTVRTTTDATGKRTTVTGKDARLFAVTSATGTWRQGSIGAGSTVGITTDYARSGNGSAYFNSTQGITGKGNLTYYMGEEIALSSLSRVSYDYFRDSASTTEAKFAPVLRFQMMKDNAFVGTLVFEPTYQSQQSAVVDSWTTMTADLTNGLFWATNAKLGPTQAAPGGLKTLAQWIAANSESQLRFYSVEVGIGSGWNGTLYGAVDNIDVKFGTERTISANFEVVSVAGAVPEPATWAMMFAGFGAIGVCIRRRKRSSATTAVAG